MMAKMYRGTFAKNGAIVIELDPNVYIVGAHALGMDSARRTVRNLPKPPRGERTASTGPPTLLPPAKPSFQDGVYGAEAAKTAPMKWPVI